MAIHRIESQVTGTVWKVECQAGAGLAEGDTILIIDGGAAKAFGPRDEVLKAHVRNYAQVAGRIGQEA